MRRSFSGAAVAVPVKTPYSRVKEHSVAWYIGHVLKKLLDTSGLQKSEIDGLALSSYSNTPDSAAVMAEYFGLELSWLVDLPMGGASGVIALMRAARAVQGGDAEVIACIGADTLMGDDFKKLIDNFSSFSRDYVKPYGAAGPTQVFALMTQYYMNRYKVERADFGQICLAQRRSASRNPEALLRKPISMEDYLAAKPIADPLCLLDCVMPCCGGEGFLVMSEEKAQSASLPYVSIAGAMETHNAYASDPVQYRGGWSKASGDMYAMAGMKPADMGFLQAYDDYPLMVMLQMEGLGFCGEGEAADFIQHTSLDVDGAGLPLNTCGGMLSAGQAGAAGGFLSVVEGIRQLIGTPPGLQVPDLKAGIVSGYGYVNYDRGLCCSAAILVNH
jgi:acetyl-CoA acetyltransferase